MTGEAKFSTKKIFIITFAVAVVALCICFFVLPALHNDGVVLNDSTPLADASLLQDVRTINLNVDKSKNYGTISIRFKNTATGDKYLVDFTFNEGYVKNALDTLPAGKYKIKLVSSGSLDKSISSPKTVYISEKDPSVVINFK